MLLAMAVIVLALLVAILAWGSGIDTEVRDSAEAERRPARRAA